MRGGNAVREVGGWGAGGWGLHHSNYAYYWFLVVAILFKIYSVVNVLFLVNPIPASNS